MKIFSDVKRIISAVRLTGLALIVALIFPLAAFSDSEKAVTETGQQDTQLSKSNMKYKNIFVANFTISPQGVQESDPKEILAEARFSCSNQLVKSGLFDNVKFSSDKDSTNSDLIVKGEVTELRIVGTGARIWLGAMAGRSKMTVHVKLIDAKSGAVVAENDIKEDSNPMGGAYSMGSADRAVPAILGGLIADFAIVTAKR